MVAFDSGGFMHTYAIAGVIVAIDFFLKSVEALQALGKLIASPGTGLAGTVDRWRSYPKVWEALFETCLDALSLVSLALSPSVVKDRLGLLDVADTPTRDALGRALGASERFAIVRGNYNAALADYKKVNATFLANRTAANYEANEAADARRGMWYRELHASFDAGEKALRRLRPMLDELQRVQEAR